MVMTSEPFPQGIVTFLVTDIEGSTRLWERDTDVMWRAVERHNTLLSEAIATHHGHHFKTIGDAYQAAFANPAQAITCPPKPAEMMRLTRLRAGAW